jgi:hypothetical protein
MLGIQPCQESLPPRFLDFQRELTQAGQPGGAGPQNFSGAPDCPHNISGLLGGPLLLDQVRTIRSADLVSNSAYIHRAVSYVSPVTGAFYTLANPTCIPHAAHATLTSI